MLSDSKISSLYFEALGSQHLREQDRTTVSRFALAVETEVRAQDTALIRQLVEALEGHQGNYKLTAREAEPVNDAITAARSRLLDSDLSKLTDRGAKAWTGIDAQDLRDGGKP